MGGSSSGKSGFAETLIVEQAKKEEMIGGSRRKIDARRRPENGSAPSAVLLSCNHDAWDEECRERIRKHRKMRKKKNFMTIECPVDLLKAEVPARSRCLLECVSNLAANEMYRRDMEDPENGAMERILEGIRMIRKNADFLVVVTNDVSGDQGPYSEETEEYRKLLGRINCALAGEADEVYEVICGEPVMVKKKKGKIQKWKREERIDLWIVREGSGFL